MITETKPTITFTPTTPTKSKAYEFTADQLVLIKYFINTTFDTRLKIALDNQQFVSQGKQEKRRRARIWLEHYSKMLLKVYTPKAPFEKAYPELLKLFVENSRYYKMFKYEEVK